MARKLADFPSCMLLDFSFMSFKTNVCNKANQLSKQLRCMTSRSLARLIKKKDR